MGKNGAQPNTAINLLTERSSYKDELSKEPSCAYRYDTCFAWTNHNP